jgi:hypothetical protein
VVPSAQEAIVTSQLPDPLSDFYEATQTEIIIHAVRHAARDPAGMSGATKPIRNRHSQQ